MVVYKNENETMRELILEETKEYVNTELKAIKDLTLRFMRMISYKCLKKV